MHQWQKTCTRQHLEKYHPMDSLELHTSHVCEILKWTQKHLDASYLESADIIIEQHVTSRRDNLIHPGLPRCMQYGLGVIWFWQM
jgi:hypothetical protein